MRLTSTLLGWMMSTVCATLALPPSPVLAAPVINPAPKPVYPLLATLSGVSTAKADNGPALNTLLNSNASRPILLPCGTFTFSTPIVQTSGRSYIQGQGANCTTLSYTGTGTAYTINSTGGNTPGFGLRDLRLTQQTHSAGSIGVQVGDPTGSNLSSAQLFTMQNVRVDNFGIGLTMGSGTWLWHVVDSVFNDNTQNFVIPSTHTNNSGEELNFTDSVFSTSTVSGPACIDIEGPVQQLNFKGGSFDNCNVTVNTINSHVSFISNHFESPAGSLTNPFVTATKGQVALRDPDIVISVPITATSLVAAANSASVVLDGLDLADSSGEVLPAVINVSGSATVFEHNTHRLPNGNSMAAFVSGTTTGNVVITTPARAIPAAFQQVQDPYWPEDTGDRSEVLNHPVDAPNNMITQSGDPSGSAWGNYGNAPTITPNTTDVTDPAGSNGAFKVVGNATANSGRNHRISLAGTYAGGSMKPGETYTASGWFRTASGTMTIAVGPFDSATSCAITTAWKRCIGTATAPAAGSNVDFEFYTTAASGVFYGYGLQTMHGAKAGGYIATTTTPAEPTALTTLGPVEGNRGVFGSTTSYWTEGSNLHLNSKGPAPTVSNCGTSPSVTGDDSSFTVTIGTGGTITCVVTFAAAFSTAPDVQFTYQPGIPVGGSLPSITSTPTNVSLLFVSSVASVKFSVATHGHDSW